MAALSLLAGALTGSSGALAWARRRPKPADVSAADGADRDLGRGVGDVLAVLRSGAIVLDEDDSVVKASPAALALGLVRDGAVAHSELSALARSARRDGRIREVKLELARGPIGRGRLQVGARVAPLGRHHVLVLIEDRTQATRVEEARRDFVANASHELKTPVGGISLLAEAIMDAKDDPEAVSRFAGRIKTESTRLGRLVQEIVDLSRLQSSESLAEPVLVQVGPMVRESVEHVATLAEARNIGVVVSVDDDAVVYGDAQMLATAMSNLLTNAMNYSPGGTRVAVAARQVRDIVEISVSDQGQGIPRADLERIFERFYRVDAARSRATGGTGLGLAIVKHICSNHGGEVTVWSEEGQGSTFTIRLPAAARPGSVGPPDDDVATGPDGEA
jgi:two-component system sensor histidine kinase SenX3